MAEDTNSILFLPEHEDMHGSIKYNVVEVKNGDDELNQGAVVQKMNDVPKQAKTKPENDWPDLDLTIFLAARSHTQTQ